MDAFAAYKTNVHSQFGEDGVLAQLFTHVAPANSWCVELGALNGIHHSNTRYLVADKGWSAVLIEPDQTYFDKLQETYRENPHVHLRSDFVEFEGIHSLDAVLRTTPIPHDFDFLSLDIDGNEYHIWDSLEQYTPRIICVEFNPSIPNDISFIQPRDMRIQQGSSAKAFTELAAKKGYILVTVTGVNLFFIRTELFPKLGIAEPTLSELNTDTQYLTRLFQLYDGTLVLDGCTKLIWRGGMPIDAEKIQVLPKSKRTFVAGISAHPLVRQITYWYRKLPVYHGLQKLRRALRM